MSDALDLAAGKLPLGVFLAVQAAVAAGAPTVVTIRGAKFVNSRTRCSRVEVYANRHDHPTACAVLKAAGFFHCGDHYAWREPETHR